MSSPQNNIYQFSKGFCAEIWSRILLTHSVPPAFPGFESVSGGEQILRFQYSKKHANTFYHFPFLSTHRLLLRRGIAGTPAALREAPLQCHTVSQSQLVFGVSFASSPPAAPAIVCHSSPKPLSSRSRSRRWFTLLVSAVVISGCLSLFLLFYPASAHSVLRDRLSRQGLLSLYFCFLSFFLYLAISLSLLLSFFLSLSHTHSHSLSLTHAHSHSRFFFSLFVCEFVYACVSLSGKRMRLMLAFPSLYFNFSFFFLPLSSPLFHFFFLFLSRFLFFVSLIFLLHHFPRSFSSLRLSSPSLLPPPNPLFASPYISQIGRAHV